MIEFDVLRLRDGAPGLPPDRRTPLVVAHDWRDAAARPVLTLAEALDAFTRPPLDRVEIDCDLKLAGREEELVHALAERGLVERSMVSTMYVESLARDRARSSRDSASAGPTRWSPVPGTGGRSPARWSWPRWS